MNTEVLEVIKAAVAERKHCCLPRDLQFAIKAAAHRCSFCNLYITFLN